jgi:dihydroorotase-like cyclic amidohydrolase
MGQPELDLFVRGDLVLPHEIAGDSAVGIKGGVIAGLYGQGENPPARKTLDFRGCLVFPGVVDAYVHSYSVPGAEGFLHSSARWAPYEGMEIEGKVVGAILRGEVVYDGKEVLAQPGYGRFVPAREE